MIIIKEKLNPRLKTALYANFQNCIDAILELTDNAVGNRLTGKKLHLELDISSYKSRFSYKKLIIRNEGGSGMDKKGLEFFMNWGGNRKRKKYDIGQYGQGGKAAIGYLGNSFKIITSPTGEKNKYEMEDHDVRNTENLKEYKVTKSFTRKREGFVCIEINLTRQIKEEVIKDKIAEVYRPLIENGIINYCFNGEKIYPKKYPLDEDYKKNKFEFSISNNNIRGWFGRLAPKSGLKGGLRCYSKGRLICDREYFGHPGPDHKATLNYLFGEIYLDSLSLVTNKTNYDRDSYSWKKVEENMFDILKPEINDLLNREIEEPSEEEIKDVKQARDICNELINMHKKINNELGLSLNKFDLGQKNIIQKNDDVIPKDHNSTGRTNNPATPPPPGSKGKRRRLKRIMEWKIRPMEENIRSKIEGDKKNKILIINNLFPGYKISKRSELYLLETAALQLSSLDYSEDENMCIDEYLSNFDELFSFFCQNLDAARDRLRKKRK